MNALEYLAGVGVLLLTLGAGWLTARLVLRWLDPGLSAPAAALATVVVGAGAVLLTAQLLGAAGRLTLPALLLCSALLGLTALVLAGATRERIPAARVAGAHRSGERGSVAWSRPDRFTVAIGAGVLGLLIAQWLAWVADRLDHGIRSLDTLTYHLPYAAFMAQQGRTHNLPYIIADQPTPFYALNTELLHALGMISIGSEFGSAFLNLALLAILLLAAFTAGWRRGPTAAWLAMTLVAAAMAAPLMAATQPGAANSDLAAVAFVAAAVALLAHAPAPGSRPDAGGGPGARVLPVLFLAALATGLAISAKISALPVAALLSAAVLVAFRGAGVLRVTAVWATGLVLTGAFWYLQNLVRTGNPVPFVNLRVGPVELPAPDWSGLAPLSASVADYLTTSQAWGFFRDGLDLSLGRGWPVLLALALTGVLAGLVGKRTRALAVVAAGGVIAYLVTPYTAGGFAGQPVFFAPGLRFAFPALVVALLLVAAALPARPAFARAAAAAALAYTCLTLIPVAPAVGLFSFIRAWPGRAGPLPVAPAVVAVAAVVVAVLVAGLVWGLGRGARWARRPLAGTVAVALLVVGVLAGPFAEGDYVQARQSTGYAQDGTTLFAAVEPIYRALRAVTGSRIGYSGLQEVHPFIGPELSNEVVFLGQTRPDGGMANATTCPAWLSALRTERVDRVVIFAGAGGSTEVYGGPQQDQITWTEQFSGVREIRRSTTPPGPYGPGLLAVLFEVDQSALANARC